MTDSKQRLRLWLRLLSCTTAIEKKARAMLNARFGTTLPRFDVMAALDREPDGLTMSGLSELLLVSNGNVTAIVARLVEDGLVTRTRDKADRRVLRVKLTAKGRRDFRGFAARPRSLDRTTARRSGRWRDQPPSRRPWPRQSLHRKERIMNPAAFKPKHFQWEFADGIATVTLNRPERKNPLTFESYAELRDLFRDLVYTRDVKVVVVTGAAAISAPAATCTRSSGRSPKKDMTGLLDFTRMTGDLVKAMRGCPQPIISAIDGICAGAGAIIAMASDMRIATPKAKTAFLFTRVGLAGCDMGACAILPRLIGQGRASELAVLRPLHERGRRRPLGLPQSPRGAGRVDERGDGDGARPRLGPDLRARHHQDPAQHRMGGEPRRRHRDGGAGAGDLHADAGFPPRL